MKIEVKFPNRLKLNLTVGTAGGSCPILYYYMCRFCHFLHPIPSAGWQTELFLKLWD